MHDEEFTGLLAGADVDRAGAGLGRRRRPTAADAGVAHRVAARRATCEPAGRNGRIVILTSGTTGTPKGAPRSEAGVEAAVSLLSRMPLHYGWRTHIAAPLFHTWGFAHLALAMLLGSTMVLRRRFDPEGCLAVAEAERCDSVVVIPVMLQRIMALPDETLAALRPVPGPGGRLVRLRAAR